jgi:AraC family transcriptional regulator
MDPVNKALWMVETRLGREVTVDDVAAVAGLSRFHLSRLFALAVGQSIMRYARGRRLSEAAKALADGAPDILTVALDHGYGSHEAFTRAFRDQFGVTPEEVRAHGAVDHLTLVEPLRMTTQTPVELAPPRFVNAPALLIAGIGERYAAPGSPAISQQWQRMSTHLGSIPGEIAGVAYGVCANSDDDGALDYIAGVEVERFADMPAEFATIRIPASRYAVFTHTSHISSVPATFRAIWTQWLPTSGEKAADAPMFERYDERFDPQTGTGDVEVWLPLET